MTAYEIQALFENQLEIMRALQNHDADTQKRMSPRIRNTKELIKLIEDQRRMGRQ